MRALVCGGPSPTSSFLQSSDAVIVDRRKRIADPVGPSGSIPTADSSLVSISVGNPQANPSQKKKTAAILLFPFHQRALRINCAPSP